MSVLQIPLWRQAPFLRLFPPFSAGIIVGKYYPVSQVTCWTAFTICIGLLIAFPFLKSRLRHHYYITAGFTINLLLVSTGLLSVFYADIRNQPQWIGDTIKKNDLIIARVDEPPVEKKKSLRVNASIKQTGNGRIFTPAVGKLILYIEYSQRSRDIAAGNLICFRKALQRIKHNGNPGTFNYAAYAGMQGIYHQLYLQQQDYKLIKKVHPSALQTFIFNLRATLVSIIRENIEGKVEAGLAEALLIGYKDDLDKFLLDAYAKTGVVHVIAISGLHLGLIYWLLALVLKPLGGKRRLRFFKAVLIIAGLWLFSLLAGASPSVLRSALMFTFIVAGEKSGRTSSIFNSLAASATVLLCYNPFWLWDTGFQLSYIAVLSLVIFMKPVYDKVFIKNKSLDTIWKLTAVTIAAQVLTFPLCIYLFHQFPLLFLISNLVAIPLSSLILLVEIFLCTISSLPVLSKPVGDIAGWLIYLMNRFILHIEKISFGTITGLQISFEELLVIYLIITTAGFSFVLRSKTCLYLSVSMVCIFCGLHVSQSYKTASQQRLIVYSSKTMAIEFINGNSSVLVMNPKTSKDSGIVSTVFQPSLIYYQIKRRKLVYPSTGNMVFSAGKKRVIICSEPASLKIKQDTDILIITGNPKLDIPNFLQHVQFRQIVFDGSNAIRTAAKWKSYCDSLQLSYWDVAEKGAFIITMN